jgi:hypothetical protein
MKKDRQVVKHVQLANILGWDNRHVFLVALESIPMKVMQTVMLVRLVHTMPIKVQVFVHHVKQANIQHSDHIHVYLVALVLILILDFPVNSAHLELLVIILMVHLHVLNVI